MRIPKGPGKQTAFLAAAEAANSAEIKAISVLTTLDGGGWGRHRLNRNSATNTPISRCRVNLSRARFAHARVGRTQSALLVLLLLVTLVVTAVLTWEGSEAGKAHERVVVRLLKEQAAFAAERYSTQAQGSIFSLFVTLFNDHRRDPAVIDVTQFRRLATLFPEPFKNQCNCQPHEHMRYQFGYDYRTHQLITTLPVSPVERNEIERLLRSHALGQFLPGWQMVLAADAPLSSGTVMGAAIRLDDTGHASYAIGFVVGPSFAWVPIMSVDTFNQRIPSLTDSGSGSRERFAIGVFSNAKPVYAGGTPSVYSTDVALPPEFGGFVVRASIHVAAVPNILGGRMPSSQLPKFAGLMILASLLILVVLILTKRESELSQVRADFVSGVSHELRTPLAQIRMFTETLLLGRVRNDAERKRSLEIIDQEAKRLTALVDNVLHLSRAERGAARLTPAATPLAPAVREVIGTFAQLPRSRGVEFRGELEERLIATVDPNAFRQILLNLLDNAVKYGPAGQRVNIGLAMFEEHARLWVDDEGPGIPVRERERVFEPFYRATQHVDSKVVGTGIGLAVVRELAGLLDGKVWAEAAPGGGARIVVEFPEAYLRAEEATGDWAVA